MNRKNYPLLLLILAACISIAAGVSAARNEQSGSEGRALANAYLAGMEAGDFDKLDALFLPDGRSNILENASDEGSWEHYRDHHLKPEMETALNFKFNVSKETEERFGDAILVQQVGTFSVDVADETRHYRVAVSYVIVKDGSKLSIAHLHWSSRPSPKKE